MSRFRGKKHDILLLVSVDKFFESQSQPRKTRLRISFPFAASLSHCVFYWAIFSCSKSLEYSLREIILPKLKQETKLVAHNAAVIQCVAPKQPLPIQVMEPSDWCDRYTCCDISLLITKLPLARQNPSIKRKLLARYLGPKTSPTSKMSKG